MLNRKNIIKILAGMLLSPALISFSGLVPNRAAHSYSEEFLLSLNFPGSPVYYGAPSRTVGGGIRGSDCIANDGDKLTALIPTSNVWTTLSDRPKFLWYVPETKAETAEFALFNAEDDLIYEKTIDLSSEDAGTIIQETLPEDVVLETGVYTWDLSLICNNKDRGGDIFIQGLVEKVDFQDREQELDELKNTLEKAGQDSLKQAQAYLDAEIYNESISLLAQMRCEEQEEWQGLLNWMGLEELATDSIAQCDAE